MSGKKFMILNSKRNYILHFLDDSAGKTSIESMEKKLDEKLSSHS